MKIRYCTKCYNNESDGHAPWCPGGGMFIEERPLQRMHGAESYPHGISCPGCRITNRCNRCGEKLNRRDRCTNGRCPKCCSSRCRHGELELRDACDRVRRELEHHIAAFGATL